MAKTESNTATRQPTLEDFREAFKIVEQAIESQKEKPVAVGHFEQCAFCNRNLWPQSFPPTGDYLCYLCSLPFKSFSKMGEK